MSIVLVQNELTVGGIYDHWKDIEGVQYHFPNQYKNKVKEEIFFIYYRGARMANGKRRIPEYFGFGRIGDVWRDSEIDSSLSRSKWWWYCSIFDYIPFPKPVPFRMNGVPYENIPSNFWSVGVRDISQKTFDQILKAAQIELGRHFDPPHNLNLPDIDTLNPTLSAHSLLVPPKKTTKDSSETQAKFRRTKYATLYGQRSEQIVLRFLQKQGVSDIRWVANEKETPGWDIEYKNNSTLVAVEVKGTSGKRFSSVEITANEWHAAQKMGDKYHLYLVADCLSTAPIIQKIQNPFQAFNEGKLDVKPLLWTLSLPAD